MVNTIVYNPESSPLIDIGSIFYPFCYTDDICWDEAYFDYNLIYGGEGAINLTADTIFYYYGEHNLSAEAYHC